MIEIHFYYGSNTKYLYSEKNELKIFEIEQKVVSFFDDQGLLNDLFYYAFHPDVEKVGIRNTVVLVPRIPVE